MTRIPVIVSLIILLVGTILCSPKNKGSNDPIWREQSLKMASGICRKMSECIQESKSWKDDNSIHMKLIEDRLQEAKCQDLHRASNVYLLIGDDPEEIKSITNSCFSEVISMSCDSILENGLASSESCMKMELIQKGTIQ